MQNHTILTRRWISDTVSLTTSLTSSGGFQGACTYVVRSHVFMNAQTGDIVPMSTRFLAGDLSSGTRYPFPLLAFAGGIFIAEQFEARSKQAHRLYWRQSILLLEILLLGIAGFLGEDQNLQTDMSVSLACTMQVQSFRRINGNAYVGTMCVENLRSGTAAVSGYLRNKKEEQLERTLYYLGITLIFDPGAGAGGNLSPIFGIKATLFYPILLIVGVVLIITEER